MRRRMAAAAAGLVLLMVTGCSGSSTPEGEALYTAGAERYDEFASGLHAVLMAVHEDTWAVRQKDFGAVPIACEDGKGYSFHAIREATPTGVSADELQQRAERSLEELGLEVSTEVFGSGEDEQRAIVGTGGIFDQAAVTIRPATGVVLVTAGSTCGEGSAAELGDLVFAESTARDQWRYLPATEGPASVPQFYFPSDGPVYYDEAGDPVDPQPVLTELPVAPYGG